MTLMDYLSWLLALLTDNLPSKRLPTLLLTGIPTLLNAFEYAEKQHQKFIFFKKMNI